jgi:hypothetical protein
MGICAPRSLARQSALKRALHTPRRFAPPLLLEGI